MTKKRFQSYCPNCGFLQPEKPFNWWIGENPRLLSDPNEFYVTDLDFLMSRNPEQIGLPRGNKNQLRMLLEIKTFNDSLDSGQFYDFQWLDSKIRTGPFDRGLHVIQWPGPRPYADWILNDKETTTTGHLDGHPVTSKDLEQFFLFEKPADWYQRPMKDLKLARSEIP